jgi:hypothetical protein
MQNETTAFWIIHHFNLKTAVKENKNGAAAPFSSPQLPFLVIFSPYSLLKACKNLLFKKICLAWRTQYHCKDDRYSFKTTIPEIRPR